MTGSLHASSVPMSDNTRPRLSSGNVASADEDGGRGGGGGGGRGGGTSLPSASVDGNGAGRMAGVASTSNGKVTVHGNPAPSAVKDGSYYCMDMRTLQSTTFKKLIDGLKDILNDTVIEFDKTGMKIMSFNTSLNVFVHLHIHADSLEYYSCDRTHRVGINMLHLNRLIKSITNDDTLTLFIESNNMNYLGIKIENNDRTRKTTNKLKTMDLSQPYRMGHVEFHKTITMNSPVLQKICRDMSNIGEFVEIKDVRDQLIFTCEGDFCSQETVLYDSRRALVPSDAPSTSSSAPADSSAYDRDEDGCEDNEGDNNTHSEEGEGEGEGDGDDADDGDDDRGTEGGTGGKVRKGNDDDSSVRRSRGVHRQTAKGGNQRDRTKSVPSGKGGGGGGGGGAYVMTTTTSSSADIPEIVQGVFSLKFLTLFTKFTDLSGTVDLLMNNDFPLLVRYPVSSLGELKLLLSEKESDDDDPAGNY